MIDVMKRLAELDSQSPTLRENQQVEEFSIMPGMMGGMPERPPMPASINMTAGSGEELSDMLATIMQLAGVKQYGQEAVDDLIFRSNQPHKYTEEEYQEIIDNRKMLISKINYLEKNEKNHSLCWK